MNLLALAAALTLAQGPRVPIVFPNAIVDDVRRLAAARDNDQRFDALTELLRVRGIPFTVEPFTVPAPVGADPRTRGRNLVVTLGQGSEEIVVGAHYDAVRLADGSLGPGAVDNGASSVMLVRVAEALQTEAPGRRVRIVWFDMEEYGGVGSTQYIEAHRDDRVTAMINFDIGGYGDTILFAPPPPGPIDVRLRDVFVQVCASEGIDCVRFDRLPRGDDRSFGKAGIPTLSVGLLPAVEAHQMWLMLNGGTNAGLAAGLTPPIYRTIHTPDDVPGKVDGASVARLYRFSLALVHRLATLR